MASSVFHIYEHIVPCQYIREYARSTAFDQEATLFLAIKQYKPRKEQDRSLQRITIIGGHANGIPKELYEPLWVELYTRMHKVGLAIESIWIADVANQGASGVLNEEMLGNDPSLFDHARDLMVMINHFRSEMPRPIVGIGHSFGGLVLVQTALTHPRLFDSLVLIEPIIFDVTIEDYRPAFAALGRPDYWPSREAAMAQCQRSSFYKSWDPRVLDLWIEHGLREVSGSDQPTHSLNPPAERLSGFTLTTSKHQELLSYLRPSYQSSSDDTTEEILSDQVPDLTPANKPQTPFYRPEPMIVFHNLPFLRPPTLFIFGKASTFLTQPGLRQRLVSTTGTGVSGSGGTALGLVRETDVTGTSHLVPLEQPGATAEKALGSIVVDIERWKRREAQVAEEWSGKKGKERRVADPSILRNLGKLRAQMKEQKL